MPLLHFYRTPALSEHQIHRLIAANPELEVQTHAFLWLLFAWKLIDPNAQAITTEIGFNVDVSKPLSSVRIVQL